MSGKNIAKQNAMAKSTFFTGQPVFANSASTSTGTKSQDQHGIWRRTLQEVFDAWTHLRTGCVPKRSTLGDANAKRRESIFGDNNFMPKHANLDNGDVRLSQGRHDAQGENRFVC